MPLFGLDLFVCVCVVMAAPEEVPCDLQVYRGPQVDFSLAVPVARSQLSVDFQGGHWPLLFSVHRDLLTQSCGSLSLCPHHEAGQPCLGRKLHLFS